MLSDPLSEVLSLLSVRSLLSASLRASGDWSLRFASEGLKFNAVFEGSCLLIPEGVDQPIRLEAGDCYLVADCGSYVMASDAALTPIDAKTVFSPEKDGRVENGPENPLFAIGGRIALDMADASLLLDVLPPFFHISGKSPEAPGIGWLLARLRDEWRSGRPGGAVATDHLAQLLFVEAIRAWMRSADGPTTGWLQAMADRRVGAAMHLIHSEPARRWQHGDLAAAAGMSRSNFALRFKQLAGLAPLDYLLRWRMRLGARALRTSTDPVSAIAFSLGYQSESAFCNAFKRVMGVAPQTYRRLHQANIA